MARRMKSMLGGALLAAGLLAACSSGSGNYIEVAGGGFVFNYRIAVAFAGLVVMPRKPLPADSSIEASFEDPAGGPPIIVRQPAPKTLARLDFSTPPLSGIVADKDYAVSVRLIAADGSELQRIDKKFHSQLDQSVLPPAPLTIGPGYARNPAAARQKSGI